MFDPSLSMYNIGHVIRWPSYPNTYFPEPPAYVVWKVSDLVEIKLTFFDSFGRSNPLTLSKVTKYILILIGIFIHIRKCRVWRKRTSVGHDLPFLTESRWASFVVHEGVVHFLMFSCTMSFCTKMVINSVTETSSITHYTSQPPYPLETLRPTTIPLTTLINAPLNPLTNFTSHQSHTQYASPTLTRISLTNFTDNFNVLATLKYNRSPQFAGCGWSK